MYWWELYVLSVVVWSYIQWRVRKFQSHTAHALANPPLVRWSPETYRKVLSTALNSHFSSHLTSVYYKSTTMKISAASARELLLRESFSKDQVLAWLIICGALCWLLHCQRRRNECIAENRDTLLKAPSKKQPDETPPLVCAASNEDASCYLCFGEGPDESGQPLRRDCSCRGESTGFAHLSCIVGYAKHKTEQWVSEEDPGYNLAEEWRNCPNCKQDYQNKLALDLAKEFVSIAEEDYPGDQRKNLALHLQALNANLHALLATSDYNLQPQKVEEANQIASKLLSMIDQMKEKDHSLPNYFLKFESIAYNNFGRLAFEEGTTEGAKAAVGYFEKCRDICDAIGVSQCIIIAEANIAQANSMFEGRSKENDEEKLKKYQKMYEQHVKQYGEDSHLSIATGLNLARALSNTHWVAAERLLTKMATTIKRVHGPDHRLTKEAESLLRKLRLYLSCSAVIIVSTLILIMWEGRRYFVE